MFVRRFTLDREPKMREKVVVKYDNKWFICRYDGEETYKVLFSFSESEMKFIKLKGEKPFGLHKLDKAILKKFFL